jgi:hypothetical protein
MRPKVIGIRHNAEGTCALGAAEDAIGEKAHWHAHEFFPLLNENAAHPEMKTTLDIGTIVASLNNGGLNYRVWKPWSRERIADWVATIEKERGLTEDTSPTVESEIEHKVFVAS